MKLLLERKFYTEKSTQGQLSIDGTFEAYTLELPFSDGLPGGAIPEGAFAVMVTYSPKFKRDMPLIVGIPERSDIRIHIGNDASETEGCILIGRTELGNFVGESRLAFDAFWDKTNAFMRAGNCQIAVRKVGTMDQAPGLETDITT